MKHQPFPPRSLSHVDWETPTIENRAKVVCIQVTYELEYEVNTSLSFSEPEAFGSRLLAQFFIAVILTVPFGLKFMEVANMLIRETIVVMRVTLWGLGKR